MHTPIDLPPPDAAALRHSERLLDHIGARLDAGPLSFADYMSLALYAPGLGYYMAGAAKFGAAGDFVTAPELSPWFGRCIARQSREMLDGLGVSDILEFGAGTGSLAESVLATLPDVRYTIVEPSAELQARQRQRLDAGGVGDRVTWLDGPPVAFAGVVLANEVLDALPVERFEIDATGTTCRVMVERDGNGFRERLERADAAFDTAVARLARGTGGFASGYRSEFCPWVGAWLATLDDHLDAGAVLLIDYGYPRRDYYHPDRRAGTLRCHYRHRAHDDPFRWPGLQDITAHVDFTEVAERALGCGFEVLGYTNQASFLLSLGLLDAIHESERQDEQARFTTAQAIGRLTLPGGMGERVQVLALGKGYDAAPRGFATLDLSHRL